MLVSLSASTHLAGSVRLIAEPVRIAISLPDSFTYRSGSMSNLSRRRFLITAAGTAAGAVWLSACGGKKSDSSSGAEPAPVTTEVKGATLGFIALTDASPLIIAKEKGFFAKHGMPDMKVVKQTSWAATRDNLELGATAGALMGLTSSRRCRILLTVGTITKTSKPLPMYILARLNVNGQGISLSNEFLKEKSLIKAPRSRRSLIARRPAAPCSRPP